MDSSELVAPDVKSDEEGWGSDDKSKNRSRRPKNGDEDDNVEDNGARTRNVGDKVHSRKRSVHSSRMTSDEDNFEVNEKSLSKQTKRQPEDALGELSSWYNDGDQEAKNDNLGHKSERGKTGSSFLEHESSQSRTTDKHVGENETKEDRDSRQSERRDYSREKDNEYSEQGRNSRRRWDEPETNWEPEESNHPERSDGRSSREERSGSDSKVNRSSRSHESKSRVSEALEEDTKSHHHELEKSELEYEQESSFKRGEIGNDDRVKTRLDSRVDRDRDWELHKRSHDRIGGRREGIRSEAVKTSSKYGISSDNYDVIEIQTKTFSSNNDLTYAPEDAIGKSDVSATSLDDKSQQLSRSVIQESSPFNRARQQGVNVVGRGGGGVRGWGRPPSRDSQPIGVPIPLMVPSFGPLGLSQLNPHMSPSVVPPISISPGVFLPPFVPPVVWPGPQGVEMGMLGVSPVMQPPGQGYPPNIGTLQAPSSYFNQAGPGRGGGTPSLNIHVPSFNGVFLGGRMQSQEKFMGPGNWVAPPRINALHGKAPSRGEQNDYSQNFVDTRMHPQNFIKELELTSVVEDFASLYKRRTRLSLILYLLLCILRVT